MTTQLDALIRTPLLGSGPAQARALEQELAMELLAQPNREAATRALVCRGERLLLEGLDSAAEVLAEASARARGAGLTQLEVHARLLTVRALAELGGPLDAQALAPRAERDGAEWPELALLLALTRSSLKRDGASAELQAALNQNDREWPAHQHLEALLRLGQGASDSERWEQADRHYANAHDLAVQHQDQTRQDHIALVRASSLLRHGRAEDALPLLMGAARAEDTRVALAAALLLSGQLISRNNAAQALPVAGQALALAAHRRSWLAFASAAIDQAWCVEQLQGLPQSRDLLTDALRRCRAEGDPGVLLQARLKELSGSS